MFTTRQPPACKARRPTARTSYNSAKFAVTVLGDWDASDRNRSVQAACRSEGRGEGAARACARGEPRARSGSERGRGRHVDDDLLQRWQFAHEDRALGDRGRRLVELPWRLAARG